MRGKKTRERLSVLSWSLTTVTDDTAPSRPRHHSRSGLHHPLSDHIVAGHTTPPAHTPQPHWYTLSSGHAIRLGCTTTTTRTTTTIWAICLPNYRKKGDFLCIIFINLILLFFLPPTPPSGLREWKGERLALNTTLSFM